MLTPSFERAVRCVIVGERGIAGDGVSAVQYRGDALNERGAADRFDQIAVEARRLERGQRGAFAGRQQHDGLHALEARFQPHEKFGRRRTSRAAVHQQHVERAAGQRGFGCGRALRCERVGARFAKLAHERFGEARERRQHQHFGAGQRDFRRLNARCALHRQREPEAAALADLAGRADGTAERVDEALRDRKAQARAAIAARERGIGLREFLEDFRQRVVGDADAAVGDFEADEARHLRRGSR